MYGKCQSCKNLVKQVGTIRGEAQGEGKRWLGCYLLGHHSVLSTSANEKRSTKQTIFSASSNPYLPLGQLTLTSLQKLKTSNDAIVLECAPLREEKFNHKKTQHISYSHLTFHFIFILSTYILSRPNPSSTPTDRQPPFLKLSINVQCQVGRTTDDR